MLVGLFAYLSIAFLVCLESPSALPSPSLDVASTVRKLGVGEYHYNTWKFNLMCVELRESS